MTGADDSEEVAGPNGVDELSGPGDADDRPPESRDGDPSTGAESTATRRRATVETRHDDPEVVAAAVTPDNTEEMTTHVTGEHVVTTIERSTTGGLRSTVDDYVVNLAVADRTVRTTKRTSDTKSNHDQ
jgi:hypothetical protein